MELGQSIVIKRLGINSQQVCQHLDNACAAGSPTSNLIFEFDNQFSEVAKILGIQLAPRSDPDKSFAPATEGTILGVHYDTARWNWAIPEDKFYRLMHNLKELLTADEIEQQLLWSVVGKLLHVAPLVPSGKFHLFHIIKANAFSTEPKTSVPLNADFRRQIWFWFTLLRTCSGRVAIPDPDARLPAWSLDIFTDAAGGSPDGSGRGAGAVAVGWWAYIPWGEAINLGHLAPNGGQLDRRMSALELFGPLLAITAAAKLCQGKPLRFWVDNSGSVFIRKKGYSTSCPLSSVLVSALAQVAAALGCKVEVIKITRCSTPLADMADALSKAAFSRFRQLSLVHQDLEIPLVGLLPPRALLHWVARPTVDWNLGDKLLSELETQGLSLQAVSL